MIWLLISNCSNHWNRAELRHFLSVFYMICAFHLRFRFYTMIPWKRCPRYQPIGRGIHRFTLDSLKKEPVLRSLTAYFAVSLSNMLTKQSVFGDLRRRNRSCGVTVMMRSGGVTSIANGSTISNKLNTICKTRNKTKTVLVFSCNEYIMV